MTVAHRIFQYIRTANANKARVKSNSQKHILHFCHNSMYIYSYHNTILKSQQSSTYNHQFF